MSADASRPTSHRHTCLDTNLAAHRARWGFAPVLPPETAPDRAAIRVDDTGGTQWPRVSLRSSDGRWLRVHSDRQPLAEAARWLSPDPLSSDAETATPPLVCVIGAGYGYALDWLADQAPPRTSLLLLEPDPAFLRWSLGRRDWTALFTAGRLMVLTGPTYDGRAEAWRLIAPASIDPPIRCHPVIGEACPDAAREAAQVVRQAVAGARANDEARQRFAGRYLVNTLRNLPRFAQAADVRTLFPARTSSPARARRPAIVAGAGPSLNRNLAELTAIDRWRDRAVFISVDTALKPSLAAHAHPHFVVGVDPGAANARMLTALPAIVDTALVCEPSLDPAVFEAFGGRTYLFKVSDTHHPWPWLNHVGADVGRLRAWGSVLTTAFDFACRLDCDPIVFIGADLAYTNGQPHARNTVYEEDWARALVNGATLPIVWHYQVPDAIPVLDMDGQPTRTSEALMAFRDWLVAQTSNDTPGSDTASPNTTSPNTTSTETTRRFINATGAGILAGPRIERATLADILAHAPTSRGPIIADVARPIADAATLADAVAAVLRTPDAFASTPLADWLAFAAGRVTKSDLHDVLAPIAAHASREATASGGRVRAT